MRGLLTLTQMLLLCLPMFLSSTSWVFSSARAESTSGQKTVPCGKGLHLGLDVAVAIHVRKSFHLREHVS